DATHDDGDVDELDRLPDHLADAGPAEHRLDDHDAAHEHADVEADQRHHRQHRVLEHVLEHHLGGEDPLGAGGAHVVLPKHVDHGAARDARVPAAAGEAHRHGRQHHV